MDPMKLAPGWSGLAAASVGLAVDSALVIALRSGRLARGDAAAGREAALMISEKIDTAIEIQAALMGGRYGREPATVAAAVLAVYARKVRANRRRLTG